MVEGDLPDVLVSSDEDLVEDSVPGFRRSVAENPVEIEIGPLAFDTRANVCLRVWEGRLPKQRPVTGSLGESGTILASTDVLADLKSVERFVEVSAA